MSRSRWRSHAVRWSTRCSSVAFTSSRSTPSSSTASATATRSRAPRTIVAFVLATALATDRPAFRRLELEAPLIVELREWSRVEDELREEWGRLANRLREQLHRFSPQLLSLCPAADESCFWALIGLAPTPPAAQRLRRAAVATLLREHRIRRLTADQVLAVLKSAPLRVAPGTVEAASAHVALLIPRLELVDRQRRDSARRIEHLLGNAETRDCSG